MRKKDVLVPETALLEAELEREKYKRSYNKTLRGTLYTLIVVAAIAVLVVTLWMPVLQIYGNSMSPTLKEGDMLITFKSSNLKKGDMVAFYYGNKLLVKRYIAGPAQWVNIDQEGNVYVDDELLEENYLLEKAYGDVDIEFPYQVPDGRYFVLGDNRELSVDSRNTILGCPSKEQMVGKIVFRIWPFNRFGVVRNSKPERIEESSEVE